MVPLFEFSRKIFTTALCLLGTCPAWSAESSPTAEDLEFFEKRIRPLLAERCYKCHSHESEKLKGGLYLDSIAGALHGGDTGPAITPGNPERSLLVEAIQYKNTDLEMPPKGKLEDAAIADLVKWVKMGAPWPEEEAPGGGGLAVEAFDLEKRRASHWCWQPVRRPDPPAVQNTGWPVSEIDSFILARLEKESLAPAAESDRRTFIRRACFDLIGLPPSPDQVAAFLNDNSPQVHANLIDALLASPHFGERWGRHWLDLVRYAETCGHEFDYPIDNAFRYRNYVIRALNEDLPYDQFIREHAAGDLLENPRLHPTEEFNESVIGSGFWFFHEAVHAPTDVRGDEADHVDNRIDVFSKTFLGLTVSCARCHDHKFDAISTKDYYALAGYLQSSRMQDAMLDPGRRIEKAKGELLALKQKADTQLTSAYGEEGSAEVFSAYLLAARDALHAARDHDPSGNLTETREDILFEDFEGAAYEGWTVEGIAFGDGPAQGNFPKQRRIGGLRGKGLVNSYNLSDRKTGTLTSSSFAVERPFINLLVGGGNHPGKTGVELLVDGEIVRTATGENNENLAPRTWDVAEFQGNTATIRIVDREKGGWGHTNVDHIVFSDRPSVSPDPESSPPSADMVAGAARARGLEPERLQRWLSALSDPAASKPAHPLFAWNRALSPRTDWEKVRATLENNATEMAALRREAAVFENFDRGALSGWFRTGHAFPESPSTSGEWAGGNESLVARPGVAHSGLYGDHFSGVLRSPTFEITHPFLHFRVKARNVGIRLIIDGYQMAKRHRLLFGGTILDEKETDTEGQWVWKTLNGYKGQYVGHKAWLEFLDQGDGFIAVDEILFSESQLPPTRYGAVTARLLAGTRLDPRHAESLATALGNLWKESVTRIGNSDLEEAHEGLLNWVWKHELLPHSESLAALKTEAVELDAAVPQPLLCIANTDGTPENERVHIRGSHTNLGEEVPRRFLTALEGEAVFPSQRSSGRLELAAQLTDPSNPLVSRVLVNRVWHHLFGRGIVPTVDDFGEMGQPPSHPELLDWMAAEFVDQGWSIKKIIKTVMLSKTYRMSGRPAPDLADTLIAARDPENALLHRMPARRLQAEAIRDAVLSVSGELEDAMFGPSVPVHLTEFMDGRGRPKKSGPLDGEGRRSIYLEVRRNFLNPTMLAFDMPGPFSTMGRRSVSNVPAQALVLMNDPFIREQATHWARRLLEEHNDIGERIYAMFEKAFARPPTDKERREILSFLEARSGPDGEGGTDESLWADLCHVLFNKKEFIYIN